MENASKALIIAGAILIAILLIGIGMFVYNSSMKPIDQSGQQMDAQAVQMFNTRIEQYAGTDKRAAQIKSLLSEIQALNSGGTSNTISVTGIGTTVSAAQTALLTNAKYTVTLTYGGNGLVSTVKSTKQ